MPGVMLFIENIMSTVTCHDVANVIEYAGFGEIYGVEIVNNNSTMNAIVELMYWDCEENEWLISVVDLLRTGCSIIIPYNINGVFGTWTAQKYNEYNEYTNSMYLSSILDSVFTENSNNDILNYSISGIIDEIESVYSISSISSIKTESYDNDCHIYTHDVNTLDNTTIVYDWESVDENVEINESYQYYLDLYENVQHPRRRNLNISTLQTQSILIV